MAGIEWLDFCNSMSLEEFAMLDDKPNVIRWAHLNFRDITLYDFGLPVNENDNTAAVQSRDWH